MELISTLLGVKRRQVTVVRGLSSRSKTIEVEGLDEAEAHARLEAARVAATDKGTGKRHGE